MVAPSFEVTVDWHNNHPVVHVRGELDFATAPTLYSALKDVIQLGATEVTLDFHQVTFLDSEGLKVILRVHRHLRNKMGAITVCGASKFVAKTFEILGLDTEFGVTTEEHRDQT
ncbi:MAG TPA: STAS domain-containing protein [Armatimonadota bacterium]|nr:STAS domain-containing protein [Armatimonadota bacterium]HOM70699.1 STAS domain-containing protein [Armatimonadota bacterium]HOP80597.1 STAS domain-containing protein [Armatimonadota bacterium]